MSDTSVISAEILSAIVACETPQDLDALRVAELGKKGRVSLLLKSIGKLEPEARKTASQDFNALKGAVTDAILARKLALDSAAIDAQIAAEAIDLTLPARPRDAGRLHPVSQVMEEVSAIFADMDFTVETGPDIEDDWHNFTALNFPIGHPAREMHDTFFMQAVGDDPAKVLRTHTSPVQVRTMQNKKPPIRVLAPGRVYRNDWDATHTPMFHQVEGLVIDQTTHMGHLKGCLTEFVKAFFELDSVQVRFRPHFFPFTEPSAEMDIKYTIKDGVIKIGEGDKWMEILGCGMVHPNVLQNCGIDPQAYQGFAFGLGIDRLAMLKYGMNDLRPYFEGDPNWTRHFGFPPWTTPSQSGGLS